MNEYEILKREVKNLHEVLEFDSLLQSLTSFELIVDTILVTVTSGRGFRFNRAFLLMIDERSNVLKGISAIGPADIEEAGEIYKNIESKNLSLKEVFCHHTE